MASSVKSTALEPTRSEMKGLSALERIKRLVPVYGLVILTVALALLFSLILPETFPTMINARSIISDKAIIAMLSLAAMIPMVAGKIDLTVGYGIVLWHILAISLQTRYGFPWPVAVLTVLELGALVPSQGAWSQYPFSTGPGAGAGVAMAACTANDPPPPRNASATRGIASAICS